MKVTDLKFGKTYSIDGENILVTSITYCPDSNTFIVEGSGKKFYVAPEQDVFGEEVHNIKEVTRALEQYDESIHDTYRLLTNVVSQISQIENIPVINHPVVYNSIKDVDVERLDEEDITEVLDVIEAELATIDDITTKIEELKNYIKQIDNERGALEAALTTIYDKFCPEESEESEESEEDNEYATTKDLLELAELYRKQLANIELTPEQKKKFARLKQVYKDAFNQLRNLFL